MGQILLACQNAVFGYKTGTCDKMTTTIFLLHAILKLKILQTAVSFKRSGRFAVKVVVIILIKKIRRILQDERAEANYFSTMVFQLGSPFYISIQGEAKLGGF